MKEFRFRSLDDNLYAKVQGKGDVACVLMATGGSARGSKSATWTRLPSDFANHGIRSVVFDFAGQGLSTGNRAELSISKGVTNLGDAIQFIVESDLADRMPLYLLGSSFGGNVVLEYLSQRQDDRVSGAVLKSPCIDLKESYAQDLGHIGMRAWKENGFDEFAGLNWSVMEDSDSLNLKNRLRAISHPAIITHGTADESVPIEQSRAIVRNTAGNVSLFEIGGANHHYSGNNDWNVMSSVMRSWILEQAATLD